MYDYVKPQTLRQVAQDSNYLLRVPDRDHRLLPELRKTLDEITRFPHIAVAAEPDAVVEIFSNAMALARTRCPSLRTKVRAAWLALEPLVWKS